ncbi:MAG: hypothetical protein A3K18_18845 [Lentisphaerae bacterium RIFOXYA12_64_32]|nr:MAG: hypothetical protein A3K18_18845 [Lentisphaerae bacterium RIFOXYA12_64_32]
MDTSEPRAKPKIDRRTVALILTEIGRRQRAGWMPTSDGRIIPGLPDDKCIASLRQGSGRW